MGSVRLRHFIEGNFLLTEQAYDYDFRTAGGGSIRPAVVARTADWSEDDGAHQVPEALLSLDDHPLLACAFACNPPVQLLYVKFDCLQRFAVENDDGVTVGDVVGKLGTHLDQKFRKGDLAAYAAYEEDQYGCPYGTEDCTNNAWVDRWQAIEEMEQLRMDEDEIIGLQYEDFDILVEEGEDYPTIWFKHEYQDRYE